MGSEIFSSRYGPISHSHSHSHDGTLAMQTPDLSIVIINWNSQEFVRKCLSTIFENAASLNYEVFVVDNASYDGVDRMLASNFPQVIFLQCERNIGFAAANNLAFLKSRGRNTLFLNPDTEIEGTAIQILISALESHPDAGVVGARLLNSDRTLQTNCITSAPALLNQIINSNLLRTVFPQWTLWGMRPLFLSSSNPVPVDAISGACMLARRSVFERVGGFTTTYFMYAEDVDLCVKISNAGSAVYYVPEASIIHHAGRSSSQREESSFSSVMICASLVRFFVLHRGYTYAALYRSSIICAATIRIVLLAFVLPIRLMHGGLLYSTQPLKKWSSILLWALGLAPWVARRQQQQSQTA